jgi:hypothetical protein
MKSIASNHFPQVRFEGLEKRLYNPVLKKRYKNRPEERVRLKWLEYLLHQTDWKKSRIGFEAPVHLRQEKNALRADLILYNKQMKPEILVECKAGSVSLTQSAAEQAARYNVSVEALYICLTNGVSDFWFEQQNGSVKPIESPIEEIKTNTSITRQTEWWFERGFCSPDTSTELLKHLNPIITHFWNEAIDWPINYLDFPSSFLPIPLNHYYRVSQLSDETKLAITFLGAPGNHSYLIAILNQSGHNSGFLSIDLELLIKQESGSATLFNHYGEETFSAHKKLPIFGKTFNPSIIENLPNFLISFFD